MVAGVRGFVHTRMDLSEGRSTFVKKSRESARRNQNHIPALENLKDADQLFPVWLHLIKNLIYSEATPQASSITILEPTTYEVVAFKPGPLGDLMPTHVLVSTAPPS